MDPSERGACDLRPASGSGLLSETPRLLSGRHGDPPPFPEPRGGVHRPQKTQVCHEDAVRDICVGEITSLFLPFC